ncbi:MULTISPECIES: nuclear transport factor 2 family protein [Luteimonas]|uniref:nuclear transport factor 2 family protein n=1 Tax=Luteimonas TaxID=83614 RepID=UPI001E5852B4|nr:MULTISPECIES: nuclear transport factor 2 family protein [Luteimonas]
MRAFPIGMELDVTYPEFRVSLTLQSASTLRFQIQEGPYARTETVDIRVEPLGNGLLVVSWQERDGATVVNLQDFDRGVIHSFATLPDGRFLRMTGTFEVTRAPDRADDDRPTRNKALVLEAMTALFQRRDASAVERFYAPDYRQHNPDIPQGRDALRALVAALPDAVYYEPGLVIAEGDLVAIHGRIRGWAETPQVVVDLFRIEGGRLAEHWDVLQAEVASDATRGGLSMFDPDERALLERNRMPSR